ncbi:hypothetical protein BS78_03G228500 [Paspalum vaginatum]|nr:hypothetical protein BS78_03G228500 [Paspalum vaginatum]
MGENECDREEDKPRFRAFKDKISSFYRHLAATKPGEAIFNPKPPSDTLEEVLTAEEMEMKAHLSRWPVCPQAQHCATIALEHYNSNKKYKFEMATVLLSKCFSEVDGTTFGHVNFTASSLQQSTTNRGCSLQLLSAANTVLWLFDCKRKTLFYD